jgi:hypothetical protein
MKTATRFQQHVARRGRFERDPRAETDDVPMDEPTTKPTDGLDGHHGVGVYMIDADAVAEAILARLIAGRTYPPPPREPGA